MLAHIKKEASECLSHFAPVFRVADIPRSLSFYRDRVGFTVEFVHESFYAGVCRDACPIHFKCSPPTPREQPDFERDEQIDACIGVSSAETLAESFALRAFLSSSLCATCRTGQSSTSAIQTDMSWDLLSPRRSPNNRKHLTMRGANSEGVREQAGGTAVWSTLERSNLNFRTRRPKGPSDSKQDKADAAFSSEEESPGDRRENESKGKRYEKDIA